MKCSNSTWGSSVTIAVVQVGAVKIYVAAVEAIGSRKRKDRMKLSLPSKLMIFSVSPPTLNANVLFFAGFLKTSPWKYDQTQGSGEVFVLLYG
jgi:hypothetical protein